MSLRETIEITSPNGETEECAQLTISDASIPFVFDNVTTENENYVFSVWAKANKQISMTCDSHSITIGTQWQRVSFAFTAAGTSLKLLFSSSTTVYLYKAQLEKGTIVTDWSPAPEDLNEEVKSVKALLELKVDEKTLISEINASADIIRLTGDRFVVDSTNLKISEDGTLEATNGKFTGIIIAEDGGIIGGFDISADGLVYGSEDSGVYTKISGDAIRWIAGIEEAIYNEYAGRDDMRYENRWFQFYYAYKDSSDDAFTLTPVGGFDARGIFTGESYYDFVNNPAEYLLTWDGIAKLKELTVNGKEVSFSGHTHNKIYNSALDEEISFIKDGNYGYFRPNTASLVYCGSSARPWYKVFTERLEVTASRPIFQPTYDNTTTYATNCYIGSTGILSRTTTTSSKTIKHDIKELQEDGELSAKKLYNIGVRQFKYNDGVITDTEDARYGKDLVGFIIEELDEIYPIAVDKPSDNVKEWSWNAQYLIPPMLQLIQDQKQEIEELKTKMNKILNALEEMGVSV